MQHLENMTKPSQPITAGAAEWFAGYTIQYIASLNLTQCRLEYHKLSYYGSHHKAKQGKPVRLVYTIWIKITGKTLTEMFTGK